MIQKNKTNENIIIHGDMSMKEALQYVVMLKEKNPDKQLTRFEFSVDGEYVDVNFNYDGKPFERIRRITGYLVGTLDRFNDAKRAEVMDRVKHNIGNSDDAEVLKEICE